MPILIPLTLTLMQGHRVSAKANKSALNAQSSATKQAISIKLATTVGHFLCDLDVTLKTFIWLDQLVLFLSYDTIDGPLF